MLPAPGTTSLLFVFKSLFLSLAFKMWLESKVWWETHNLPHGHQFLMKTIFLLVDSYSESLLSLISLCMSLLFNLHKINVEHSFFPLISLCHLSTFYDSLYFLRFRIKGKELVASY